MTEIQAQPNNLYYSIKSTMPSQSKYELFYPHQNFIPNKLKSNESERKFLIKYFEPHQTIPIRDFIHVNADIHIHVATGTCKLITPTNRQHIFKIFFFIRIDLMKLQNPY